MKVSRYCNPVMKQLTDQQVRYAPHEVRLVQMKRAERLARELDPTRSYPYREICERVTTFRPEMYPDLVIGGQDAVHDLRCFVEDLSESTDLDVAHVDEPVLTVQEISDRYNVSTKTVDRWRDRGLVSRRFKVGNRRRRIGFLKSSVESFVKNHANEVHRSSPVQPTFGMGKGGDRGTRAPVSSLWRLPLRNLQAFGAKTEAIARNDPVYIKKLRPCASGVSRVPLRRSLKR